MKNQSFPFCRLPLVLLALLFISQTAQAAELEPEGTCQRKFQRGVMNMAFAPLEITHALALENREKKTFLPWFMGLGRGSWLAVIRAAVGVYEVVTFPFPIPSGYQPIVLPESPLEYLGPSKDET